jgi:putative oxidoreductase
VLRVGAAFPLIYFGLSELTLSEPVLRLLPPLVAAGGGILLLVGLWTPVAGIAIAIGQVWNTLSPRVSQQEGPWIGIVLAVLSAGIALLGPGAWSIDAHLFGRRRFEIDGRNGQR